MRKWMPVIIFIGGIIGITYYYNTQQQFRTKQALSMYVPCGMTIPFKELSLAYGSSFGGKKVVTTFDNANVLVKLILDKGKIPDIFVSPGKKEIGLLREKGMIEEPSVKPFGRYELVLIAPSKSENIKEVSDILNESVKTIVIANPDFNSIGDYALQSLKSLGYWDKLQNKIVLTNTPIEALSYIATSKADAGIHYNVCPFETSPDKVSKGAIRIVATLPQETHEPIYSYIGILKDTPNKEAAKKFINFMFSKKGEKILKEYGLGGTTTAGGSAAISTEVPKVIIEAYYPFNEEHFCMKEYFESLRDKYKGRAKVECVDFREDKGYVRWRKSGLTCGGVLINRKNKFTIDAEGAPREVEFIKKMDIFWTKEELEAAIEQELK